MYNINFINDLYNNIKNPLYDDETIIYLIENYNENFIEMYKNIVTKYSINKKHIKDWVPNISNELYSLLYNVWKNDIFNLDEQKIEYLLTKNIINKDFYDLKTFLETLPNITTKGEYLFLYNKFPLIKKYGFNKVDFNCEWNYISTKDIYLEQKDKYNINHRLYLNPESIDTENIVLLFINKCIENNIKFQLKYSLIGNRDDCIVIYSDNENIENHLNILKELEKENKELFSNILPPPILTGKINNWIGYGEEPIYPKNNTYKSYNSFRTNPVITGIKLSTQEWNNTNNQDKTPKEILKIDSLFIEQVRNNILKESEQMNIDSNSYCFNTNKNIKIKTL